MKVTAGLHHRTVPGEGPWRPSDHCNKVAGPYEIVLLTRQQEMAAADSRHKNVRTCMQRVPTTQVAGAGRASVLAGILALGLWLLVGVCVPMLLVQRGPFQLAVACQHMAHHVGA